jgi:iron complex transport system ATP-binding protein
MERAAAAAVTTVATPLLATRGLPLSVAGRALIDALDLDVHPGMFVAVLGRNGSGKTLLLQTLAGLRAGAGAAVSLAGQALASQARRDVARRLALLPQDSEPAQHTRVRDCVALGRYAYLPLWGAPQDADNDAVDAALAAAELTALADRDTATLSGGELRRTAIAIVLAQCAPLMLLDEPTNHLDPHHALQLLDTFRARVDAGSAVIATLHEPNLAARFATHALLLHGDGRAAFGTRDQMLHAAALTELYGTPIRELKDGERRVFVPA